MKSSLILRRQPLGFPWPALDPFLFCVHHDDRYPKGNGALGPAASLAGHTIGQDFGHPDGWSLYHGSTVPGFPAHPHRGFETVTVVLRGRLDHSDSLGAAARLGDGDVQWLTAGRGIVHAEMFPLLNTEAPNPLELFQIWLNLPARHKFAEPNFSVFWGEDLRQRCTFANAGAEVLCVAGRLMHEGQSVQPPAPPPDSWAASEESDLAIWLLRLQPGANWTLPAAGSSSTNRMLYYFAGEQLQLAGALERQHAALELDATQAVALHNTGASMVECLLLQARPIGEPTVQYGPFVMNSEQEVREAMSDYRATQFGGWPWADQAPTHGHDPRRFARYPDGHEESPN